MVWFEDTVKTRGLSVDPLDQLTNSYSASAVALTVTVEPSPYSPPVVSTEPPTLELIVTKNDGGVSFEHEKRIMNTSNNSFLIVYFFSLKGWKTGFEPATS